MKNLPRILSCLVVICFAGAVAAAIQASMHTDSGSYAGLSYGIRPGENVPPEFGDSPSTGAASALGTIDVADARKDSVAAAGVGLRTDRFESPESSQAYTAIASHRSRRQQIEPVMTGGVPAFSALDRI